LSRLEQAALVQAPLVLAVALALALMLERQP
jgi:hypothetical protein